MKSDQLKNQNFSHVTKHKKREKKRSFEIGKMMPQAKKDRLKSIHILLNKISGFN